LGQGGAQFDRRGQTDPMGNGQGAYKLATHGARVPIQFAISNGGWALYIHQPLGVFDLTGTEGVFQTPNAQPALPLDFFIIGATTPAAILGEYAKITGYAEMPAAPVAGLSAIAPYAWASGRYTCRSSPVPRKEAPV
jgi:alpha-glucosidase